jgi:hypothetical protein
MPEAGRRLTAGGPFEDNAAICLLRLEVETWRAMNREVVEVHFRAVLSQSVVL